MKTKHSNRVTKWIRWIARIGGFSIIVFALLMLIGYAWNWVTTGVADPNLSKVLSVISKFFNSNLCVLIVASIIASRLCPIWLQSSATYSAERKWQFDTREKVLNRLDKAAWCCLKNLQSKYVFNNVKLDDLQKELNKATEDMNNTMVGIRLLFGSKVLEKFRSEVDEPIRKYLQSAIKVKENSDNSEYQKFLGNRKKRVNELSIVIDKWEENLSKEKFQDLY